VHNPDWALTNNAMSLALALDDQPSYVVSGDIFIAPELIQRLDNGAPDLVLVSDREKRSLSAIHCVMDQQQQLVETYQGPVRSMAHPESVGIFKISSPDVLRAWRRRCTEHSNLFAGQLLPCDQAAIGIEKLGNELFFEVNTPTDYLELIEASRNG
jgi:choline kinase